VTNTSQHLLVESGTLILTGNLRGQQMKRIAIIAVLFSAIGSSAFAADMAVKAPPLPAAPVSSWTGFYIGVNGGGIWDRDELTATPADPGTTAFFGPCFAAGACPRDYGRGHGVNSEFGGQAGYNKQINNFIVGIETDLQWTHAGASSSVVLGNGGTGFVPFNGQAASRLDWFGTTRGRLGILASPSMLLYGTGGLAYGAVTRSWTMNFVATGQDIAGSERLGTYGWTAGAGAEWMIAPHWILGVEYLHIKFSPQSFGANGVGSAGCTAANCNFSVRSGGLSTDIARLKVDYKF
jgi:outer membrane immunogenic protein